MIKSKVRFDRLEFQKDTQFNIYRNYNNLSNFTFKIDNF